MGSLNITKATLCVRSKGDKNFLRLKSSYFNDNVELVSEISTTDFNNLKNGTFVFPQPSQRLLKKLTVAVHRIEYLGFLETHRIVKEEPIVDGEWSLDYSRFPSGTIDYELELKFKPGNTQRAKQLFGTFLGEHNIEFVPTTHSKFERFLYTSREQRRRLAR